MQDYRKLIKPKFEERYKEILKDKYEDFIEHSLKKPTRSIRVNTLKITVPELKKRLKDWKLTQVPWCNEGFWIEHKTEDRIDIGNTVEHCLGYFYVQDAASMIPPLVLDPKPGEHVLDMCAAPGSKASQIAQMMNNKGALVANDYKGIRLAPLGINMQRMGVTNCVITLMEGRWFKDFRFDKILVDAPCSGTGTIRKSLKTLTEWSPGLIRSMSKQQRRLLETGFMNLKKGGTLVYSTCSVEPEENEAVITWLLENYPDAKLEKISIKGLKTSPSIVEFEKQKYNPEINKCLRIWPQDNDTEGFFVAKIQKR
ncbi:RsmB/NOP family class I SAM-dependent RNA methyltransferase [Candidatus Woesearchaeota archaeon]|nr:RsmB/NOP family class I SAM-dependent RNA methyltransferase [Candidatus Woesearchaeota archaeon]MBW3021375.1 RsmB/NOP family class I SAM-dependent RNA methyltransferase [Candidatus Woesearchaeota archaeon]